MAIRDVVAKYVLRGEDQTSSAFASANKAVDRAEGMVRKYAATVAAAAGPAALVLLTRQQLQQIDALAKQSDRLRIATEDLQAYKHLAKLTGGDGEAFVDVLQEMNIRLGEAATGSGEAAGMIKTLGLDLDTILKMEPGERMQVLAGAIANLEDPTAKAAAANKLFGGSAVKMLNTIEAIPGGLEDARAELDALGVTVSRIDAAKVEAANDSLARAGQVAEGLGNQLAVGVAPFIEAISVEFTEAAASAGGFESVVQKGMEVVAKSVGIVADGVHGLRIIWKGLEIVANSAVWVIIQALAGLLTQVDAVLGGVNAGINVIIRSVNALADTQLPELDTSPLSGSIEFVAGVAESLEGNIAAAAGEMHDLAMQPLPSEGIEKFFNDVQTKAQETAEKVAASRETMTGAGSFGDEKQKEAAEKARQQAEQQLADLEAFLGREEMSINQAFERRREMVEAAFEQRLIDEERRNVILEELNAKHQQAITDAALKSGNERARFEAKTWSAQVATVAGALESMSSGVATESRAMFNINKAAGIANAIINTSTGVTRALAEYPPPLSFVMAAAQLAAGMAQVNAIKSTQFGGGTTPSVAGSTPTFNGQPVGQGGAGAAGGTPSVSETTEPTESRRVIEVRGLDGDGLIPSKKFVRDLIDAINEEAGDGVRVVTVRSA